MNRNYLAPVLFVFSLIWLGLVMLVWVVPAQAQELCGTWTCCTEGYTPKLPPGCNESCLYAWCNPCTGEGEFQCTTTSNYPCAVNIWGSCTTGSTACIGNTGSGCSGVSCPSGQIFCGAQGSCAAGCRATGGLTCTQWLNANCGAVVPPPPGCTPSCSSPYCGQSDGCGGTCATTDGRPSLNIPTIGASAPAAGSTTASPVFVNWTNVAGAATYRYQVQRLVAGVYQNYLLADVPVSQVSLTLSNGSYRVRVRALQAVCPASDWTTWRQFNVGAVPACSITLNPNTISTPAGEITQIRPLIMVGGGTLTQVDLVSDDPAVATIEPSTWMTDDPYEAEITSVAGGSATITLTGTVLAPDDSVGTCQAVLPVTVGELSGRVCLAPIALSNPSYVVGMSGSSCVSVPSNQCDSVDISDGESIEFLAGSGVDTGRAIPINADGTFRIPVQPGIKNIALGSSDATNTCECPGSCEFATVVAPNPAPITFYYNPVANREPWWQVIGGSVYAGRTSGTAVFSPVPVDTCGSNVSCVASLILRNGLNTPFSSGAVVTGGGTIDVRFGNDGPQDDVIDEDARNLRVIGSTMTRYVENYTYLARLYGIVAVDPDARDWSTIALSQPTTAPTAEKKAYYQPGDGVISTPWSVSADERIIVFITGDLDISANISVAQGGFLAFVVSGDITIADSVCQSDYQSDDAVVEGVFIANGSIRVLGKDAGGDCKFVGEGVLVGHNGVMFERDFMNGAVQTGYNSIQPVAVMKDRPDFLINLPVEMRRPMIQWQEVVQ